MPDQPNPPQDLTAALRMMAPTTAAPAQTEADKHAVPDTLPTPQAGQHAAHPPTGGKRARRLPESAQPAPGPDTLDWAQVGIWRTELVSQLEGIQAEAGPAGLTNATLRERGRAIIHALLDEHNNRQLARGEPTISGDRYTAYAQAVFNARFGLGRLQPLLDIADVEDVYIIGYDNVTLRYADGRKELVAPVAESDHELIETIANLAVWNNRAFDEANPALHIDLPESGARLFANAWTSHRPMVTIRRHLYTQTSLDALISLGTLDTHMAEFLRAAVRAKLNIIIAGGMAAGKTTLLRALAAAMDPEERFATIETEYELHLHDLPDQHHQIVAFEARPGTGDLHPDGTRAGAITERELLHDSLRGSFSRTIVGEVRSTEIWPMIEAMLTGSGSLSTTHVRGAESVLDRLYIAARGQGSTYEEVMRALGLALDLVVYIQELPQTEAAGTRRVVTSVVAIGNPVDAIQPDQDPVYTLTADGRHHFHRIPETLLRQLELHGLPRGHYNREAAA